MILTGLTGIGQGLPGGLGYVLDHGHPRHIDAVAGRYSGLKVLAARQFSPALKKAIAGRLQDRVMFGCDFPVLRFEKVIEDWRSEGYTEQVLRKVLHDNAEAYFSG